MENNPVVRLNLRKRANPAPERSAQVKRSCQRKLWMTAVSTANAVAIR